VRDMWRRRRRSPIDVIDLLIGRKKPRKIMQVLSNWN